MKIVVSPAKSLEQERKLPSSRGTQPQFLEDAIKINRKLSRMSKPELSELMSISDKLAELNYQRYQDFDEKNKNKNVRPAVYLFNGDVYDGLDAYNLSTEKLDDLQNSLRILSGMYGILKPLDLIQPYRLEMGTKLGIQNGKNLYGFWRKKITQSLNDELKEGELFLNLASQEYFKAVAKKALKTEIISPVFKDFKNGKLKIISFYAKKARGAMVRYILDKNSSDLDDVMGFDYMDYRFSEKYTEIESEPVFVR